MQPDHRLLVDRVAIPSSLTHRDDVQIVNLEEVRRCGEEAREAHQRPAAAAGCIADEVPGDLDVHVEEQMPARRGEALLGHQVVDELQKRVLRPDGALARLLLRPLAVAPARRLAPARHEARPAAHARAASAP